MMGKIEVVSDSRNSIKQYKLVLFNEKFFHGLTFIKNSIPKSLSRLYLSIEPQDTPALNIRYS